MNYCVDIYEITPQNISTFNEIVTDFTGRDVDLCGFNEARHHIFITTTKTKSLDLKNIRGLAETFHSGRSVEICKLTSSAKYIPILAQAIVKFFQADYFWSCNVATLKCKFEEIEPLDEAPITKFNVSRLRQFIYQKPQPSRGGYYTPIKTFHIAGIDQAYQVLKTMDDGSCFFHSILYEIHPNYRTLDPAQQHQAIGQFRGSLAKQITPELFLKLGNGMLAESVTQEYCADFGTPIETVETEDVWRHYVSKLANTRKWVGTEGIELMYSIFSIGVLLLTPDRDGNPSIYNWCMPDDLFEKCRRFVVMWYDNSHYDVVVVDQQLINWFKMHHDNKINEGLSA